MRKFVTITNLTGQEETFQPAAIRKIMPVGNEAGVVVGSRIILGYQTWIDTAATHAEIAVACGDYPVELQSAVDRLYEACGEEGSEEEAAIAALPKALNDALADVIRLASNSGG